MARVLVVDDVPDNVRLLAEELADDGHVVLTASDGDEAMAEAVAGHPDVILLDVMMPGLDGIEVCRRLKADPQTRAIPIIIVSARGLSGDVVLGLDAGATDYVTKPFDLAIVLARVRSALRAKAEHDLIVARNRHLTTMAGEDALTGLKNRRALQEALESSHAFAARQGLPLSLLILDVDNFKQYNDTFGHVAGDEVLFTIGQLLRREARGHDIVARYGGEEFVMVLPATDAEPSRAIAERLRQAIAAHDWPRRRVTASLGVATLAPDAPDTRALLREADRALYHSKARGRDRVTHALGLSWPPPEPTDDASDFRSSRNGPDPEKKVHRSDFIVDLRGPLPEDVRASELG